ncbi:MAG TPA: patatin-like phospholipase family protein [Vitreimonas sp.]|uniref:patatin-like phospholipase family protein n=1 Tax=Vitreimonas sp. TaxID=3069702 RepID=UPI002D709090|nr:patatin-like phospholipase family protein [Vitreimonas sp.]HYD87955.1 patatin-like phospholipase family protein [Vitreimonas sp.]
MKPSLAEIPNLRDAPSDVLMALDAVSEWFSIPAGWPLINAGEPPEGVYFLLTGSLAAFKPAERGGHALLGYIRPGEPVGEMAMIAREPHSASVFAMRDSEILKLPPVAFDLLVHAHPAMMEHIARIMLTRARASHRNNPRADPKVYALISTSPTIDIDLRARTLQAALRRLNCRAVIVTEDDLHKMSAGGMNSAWFDALEAKNDAVFLVSPIADTPWFRTCIRQADRIWFFARADARPSMPLLPPEEPSPARQFRLIDVVLLHHGMDRKAATTNEWRVACEASRLFHWRGLEDEDAARLARVIARRSIGLVLSGGGARAYAHIGVVRALREAGLPFDVSCGTSMGAIIAACVAMGWKDDEIEYRIRKSFVESNPLGDYVIPVVGLVRGRRVEDRLQEHFGETLIEDLGVPFFAVSTDLVAGDIRVHRGGLLRKALRASISLPGILPPVIDGEQGLLVDGAVLKNFPVDVLKQLHRGPIIGVDVARRDGIDLEDFRDPPGFLGWVAAHGFQSAPPIASLLMRAATLAIDPWEGRSGADVLIAPEMPDIDMRDWKRFDDVVAAGYESAVAALQRPHGLFHSPSEDAIGDMAGTTSLEIAE